MNQKTDDAEAAGTERRAERTEELSSRSAVASEQSSADADQSLEGASAGRPPVTPPAAKPGAGSRAVGALAGFAAVLALATLAAVGYLAWQGRHIGSEQADTDASVASLSDNLDETLATLDGMRERLSTLAESDTRFASELESLERQIEGLLDRYESLPARLSGLETAMSSLQGISAGVRDNWWLSEAEYYMQMANAQLQLAGNPRLAQVALEFADERLRQLGNPALTDVRRALAGELRALEAIARPDVEGITMRLASLSDSVESLPIEEYVTATGSRVPPVGEETGAFDRAAESLKRAFSGVVSVRRTDEEFRPLLPPDARYFLHANLKLQMQTARLAMLRGEGAVFEQSLQDAASWLREYFDTDSAAVRSALETIAEVSNEYVPVEPPDISRSLALLRQYRTLTAAERGAQGSNEGADDGTQ